MSNKNPTCTHTHGTYTVQQMKTSGGDVPSSFRTLTPLTGAGGRGQGDFKGTCTVVLGFCFLERVEANLAKMIDVGKSRWWMHEVYYVSSL